ncbi:MAG: hypothetical protein ACP5GZ_00150 [Vulcanisaeta sp.]|jgi:hypothetical protein|uniref:hypothetical protein n=1 Tax=Vulcanisaeta sp. TaxID=2020871 RepID=UPI003D11DBA2
MECKGDYYIEIMDKEVKAIRQVRALSSNLTEPRYRVTYVITSNEPRAVRVRYVCGGEAGEAEVVLSKVMRFVIELLRD